jgi:BRCT domain type II-containing protein
MTQSHQKYNNPRQQKTSSSSATQSCETKTTASTATANVSTAEAELDAPAPLPLTELSGVARVEEEVLLVVVDNVVLEEGGDGEV